MDAELRAMLNQVLHNQAVIHRDQELIMSALTSAPLTSGAIAGLQAADASLQTAVAGVQTAVDGAGSTDQANAAAIAQVTANVTAAAQTLTALVTPAAPGEALAEAPPA